MHLAPPPRSGLLGFSKGASARACLATRGVPSFVRFQRRLAPSFPLSSFSAGKEAGLLSSREVPPRRRFEAPVPGQWRPGGPLAEPRGRGQASDTKAERSGTGAPPAAPTGPPRPSWPPPPRPFRRGLLTRRAGKEIKTLTPRPPPVRGFIPLKTHPHPLRHQGPGGGGVLIPERAPGPAVTAVWCGRRAPLFLGERFSPPPPS